ncbi:MAG: hypothetical protein M3068_02765 [Gemmatimonadota bacterium]|nr:hypothetical protein [Gemmatimonadota bacterium]
MRPRTEVAAMNPFTLLALLSLIGAAALFIALALFLNAITTQLEKIGGEEKGYGVKASYLSRIRVGVRAIETETGMIAPQVTQLNTTLTKVRDGLVVVDGNLGGVIAAVSKQVAT